MKPTASRTRCCCIVRCAATCRTVHPSHSEGCSHCSGVRPSSSAAVLARWSSIPAHKASVSMGVKRVMVPPSGEDRGLHPGSLDLVELWVANEQSGALEYLDRLLSTRDPVQNRAEERHSADGRD